jgi:hypothetical protein
VAAKAREGCGLFLPASSGAPGEKGVVVISAKRRVPVDQELQLPGAPAVDVEATDADVCFEPISGGRLLARPNGRTGTPSVTFSEDDALDRWLLGMAGGGRRVGLIPSTDCGELLRELQGRGLATPSAWVQEGSGLSRCERDSSGRPHVDPTKTHGYDGVIIMQPRRG